jgi:hypothetical protein
MVSWAAAVSGGLFFWGGGAESQIQGPRFSFLKSWLLRSVTQIREEKDYKIEKIQTSSCGLFEGDTLIHG